MANPERPRSVTCQASCKPKMKAQCAKPKPACKKRKPRCPKPKPACPKKKPKRRSCKKKLPSINPFFHFLKRVWRKFRGCKRNVVIPCAVKKWNKMTKCEKAPFIKAAQRGQLLHRRDKCARK